MGVKEKWVSLLDYAVSKGVSTSTLRRHIKAKKIPYRIEDGRYLLLIEDPKKWDGAADLNMHKLEEKLLQAQEQISELKMLVALYEEKLTQADK